MKKNTKTIVYIIFVVLIGVLAILSVPYILFK